MVLDWLSGPLAGEVTVTELIARKKYARAIEFLKQQAAKRPPSIQARLQMADVLVLAGRMAEAIPGYLAIADEQAAEGFDAKAIAILKKVQRLDPARPEVEEKLAALAKKQQKVRPTLPPAPSSTSASGMMKLAELGI